MKNTTRKAVQPKNTDRVLPRTFSTGKSVHVAINYSDEKQKTITGNKTIYFINGITFQLQTINSPEVVSLQNKGKTAGESFTKDPENNCGLEVYLEPIRTSTIELFCENS